MKQIGPHKSPDRNELYEFEGFRLDIGERLLERKGKRVDLTDRAFDVLSILVRNAGKLVTKDQLLEQVWPGTFVEENSINKNVSMLRKSLGQGKGNGKFIETVRGRGFRFIAKVSVPGGMESRQTAPATASVLPLAAAPEKHSKGPLSEIKKDNVVALVDWRPLVEAQKEDETAVQIHAGEALGPRHSRRNYFLGTLAAGVFLIGAVAILLMSGRQAVVAPPAEIRTIAVLPFKPMAEGLRDEAFEIGMADTLISKLSGGRQIIVRPLSAVIPFGSRNSDELEAGKLLQADAVLDGSIQRSHDKVRINVRLLRVADGVSLWSDTFDEQLTDIFAVQDAISHKVVASLNVKLNAQEETHLSKHYTDDPQAYEYFLRGRTHYYKITLSDLETAAEFFKKAIDTDPDYALAYAWLSEAYRTQSIIGLRAPDTVNPTAKQYVAKALELDETLPDAHVSLAWIHLFYDWDWDAAEREARRAIDLAPNNSEAHRAYAHLLSLIGRHDEAITASRRARELAPLTMITATLEGQFLMFAGRLNEAEERLNKTLEIDPDFWVAHNILGKVYFQQGRYDEAIRSLRRSVDGSGRAAEPIGHLGHMLAQTGRPTEARELLRELEARQKDNSVAVHIAAIKCGLGYKVGALNELEKAFDQREAGVAFLNVSYQFSALRDEQRFKALLRKMNLG